jgi:hypothetical protein
MHFDGEGEYHSSVALVYVGPWVLEQNSIWLGVDDAESRGISLERIALALARNWPATVVALAFRNIATLRVLIDEAARG